MPIQIDHTGPSINLGTNSNGLTVNGSSFVANSANKVSNSQIIKFDTGTTEGTDLYTFDGSSGKLIDIKAGNNISISKDVGAITISANATSVAWSEITSKPTNLLGLGITDVYTKTEVNTALGGKSDTSHTHTASNISGLATVATSGSYDDLTNKPSIPTVPTTVSYFTNDSGYQTGSDVDAKIALVVDSAPAALDTLKEIAAQLSNDESAVSALTATVSLKAPLASPTFTGTVSGITKDMVGLDNVDNTSDSAKPISTATQAALDLKANAASLSIVATSGSYTDLTNKPSLGTSAAKDVATTGDASETEVVLGNDSRLTDARIASDVYAWAKATTKPTYTASEVGAADATHNHALSIGDGTSNQIAVGTNERLDIVAGSNVSVVFDDATNKVTISTTGTLSGNADTATKLLTPRTIGMTGDVTWTSAGFDGSTNVTGVATLANSGVTGGTYSGLTINNKGLVTNATSLVDTVTGIDAWVYNDSFSNSTQDSEARGLTIDPTGTKLYIIGNSSNSVHQYTLATPWTVASAVYDTKALVTTTQEGTPYDLAFSSDGTKIFVIGAANTVFVYGLTTPWDVSTATYSNISFLASAQDTGCAALAFNADGTKMYIGGMTNDKVYEYTLSTAWDVTTAVYSNNTISLAGIEGSVQGIAFNSDGTKLYVTGSDYARITEYTLSTAWALASAVYSGATSVGLLSTYNVQAPSGIFVNLTQNKVWITDYSTDRVFELSTNKSATSLSANKIILNTDTEADYNFTVNKNLRINGSILAPASTATLSTLATGSLTASSGVTMSTTTGTISIATSQTTGATTIGGTAQTGTIQIGRSTAAQTVNIATGANTTGVTKTVNIATGGATGSTSNIAIGSTIGTTATANGTWNFTGGVNVTGNLVVNGTTTTINSSTITVDDKNIELGSVGTPTDTTADGGGITLKGATDKTIIWDLANTNWTSSENLNVASGKTYKINNVDVVSSTTLGTSIVNSSLTKVGLTSSGFVKSDASGNLTVDTNTYYTKAEVDAAIAAAITAFAATLYV